MRLGRPAFGACAEAHGYHVEYVYHPLSHFWPLQFVESGILVGLAVLLFGIAAWWTLRRIS